jgi:hypothetical protein
MCSDWRRVVCPTVVTLAEVDGKPFALLLCAETEDGENDWAVFPGIARVRDGTLFLERSGNDPDVEIRPEWHHLIRPVKPEVRQILLGADYSLSLSVGNLPDDAGPEYLSTGLKWPQ